MQLGPESDPISVFRAWYAENASLDPEREAAMALATVGDDGQPSLRMVLLKGVVAGRFRFFTHYESRKGRELSANPKAALLFHWPLLGRQVRVEGAVQRIGVADSDAYFATRPRESQLSASISPQSQPISRHELESRRRAAEERLGSAPVPRPPHWGGYDLEPRRVELWLSDAARLHHRHEFVRAGDVWRYGTLAP